MSALSKADRRLSKFLPIIRSSPVYPVIYDSRKTVLSLPPIINGDFSKIHLGTKNVFIECTATDLTKAKVVLNMMTTMFAEYCQEPFCVEPVEIIYEEPSNAQPHEAKQITPELSIRRFTTTFDYIISCIGNIKLTNQEVIDYLGKMSLEGRVIRESERAANGGQDLEVFVPPTRSDILHACDIMEDVAIAYGFNNIPKTLPATNTIAAPFALNKLADSIRRECALAGFVECAPLILCSRDENFSNLRLPDSNIAVSLLNPATAEYQVVRTSLLQGVLKTVSENKKLPLPMRIFEVGDIVLKNDSVERGARNVKRVCALWCGRISGFEIIHELLDRLMMMLNVPLVANGSKGGYYIIESEYESFFPGRSADIYFNAQKVGHMGIIHPEVLDKFEMTHPCTALEFDLEPFL